tara:strand:+ start:743 stop:1048 length:306 start_codon:yes stop_codon:yes gene_type:complete
MMDFNNHPWVHQGNINKVKKIIMEVEEFQRIRIEALEKQVVVLENVNKELKAELKLENENKRSHVVGLQLQIEDLQEDNNNLVEVIKGLDPTNPILQHLKL